MKVVLDTNVIVSGAFWGGPPSVVLDGAILRVFQAVISEEILAELDEVVSRAKFDDRSVRLQSTSTRLIVDIVRDHFEVISLTPKIRAVQNDADDDAIISCAVAAQADYIVSGDKHLLSMQRYRDIPICTVDHFITAVLPILLK